jgi:homoserine kinase
VRPTFRAAPVRVRVPASAANLGPGFDAFGLALALYDDVVLQATESGLSVDVAGEGADALPRTGRHLLVRAARAAFAVLGGAPRGLQVVCANRIPQSAGLGSSAAAIVAGVVAARALTVGGAERLDDAAAYALATRLEGHPDNVAACFFGGLTLAWSADDQPAAVQLRIHNAVAPVAFLPPSRSSTAGARRLLPQLVPHADAAHSAGRAALLVEALGRRPDLLLPATEDRLHQAYRAPAMARSAALVARLRAAGIPAVISGAGPTVLALTTAEQVEAATARAGSWFVALPVGIDRRGARVVPVDAGPAE